MSAPAPTTTPAELGDAAADLQARINHAEFSRAANDDAWPPTPDRLVSYLLRRPADLLALSAACFIAWFCLLGAPI